MATRRVGRQGGRKAGGRDGAAARPDVVKVSLRLSGDTARRLAVESAMSGESQCGIAERVLAAYLKRWRLPSTIEAPPGAAGESAGDAA